MIHFADWLGHWSVDVYLLGSVLFLLALLATAALPQPVHRLAITKSLLLALALLACMCAIPGWSAVHLITAKPTPPIERSPYVPPLLSPASEPSEVPVANLPLKTPILVPQPTAPQTSSRLQIGDISAWTFAGGIELLGALAVVIWLATGWAAARTLRRQSHEAPLHIQELLQQIAKSSPSKHATASKILISNRINVPVALGILRPTIILPQTLIDSPSTLPTPPSALSPILAHEHAHIQNHDLHWLALSRLLLIILWPQPLFWFARRRMRLDQESLADAAAADLTTREKYAEQLVAWARNLSNTYPTRLASAVGLWEGASQLRQRVALLLDERITILRQFSRKWQLATLGICTVVAASLSLVTLQPAQSQTPKKHANAIHSSIPTPAPGMPFEKLNVSPNSIAVRVVDEHGQPIRTQQLELFRIDLGNGTPAVSMVIGITNNDGTVTFDDLIHPDYSPFFEDYPDGKIEARPGKYGRMLAVLVKSPGHASWLYPFPEVAVYKEGAKAEIRLQKSASIKGRVTNAKGEPVAGATVTTSVVPIPGFQTTTTDTDGRYELPDVAPIDLGPPAEVANDSKSDKERVDVFQLNLIVRHPNYAEKLVSYSRIPSTIDAQLEPGGVIEGRVVVPREGDRPINIAARVCADPVRSNDDSQAGEPRLPTYAGMDATGRFHIGPLHPGHYRVFCEKAGWFDPGVNAGFHDIEVRADETTHLFDLELTQGSVAHVQLIDDTTHQPVSLETETRGLATIAPEPATNKHAVDVAITVSKSGRFDLRMPPSKCGLSVFVGDWSANATEVTVVDVPVEGSADVELKVSNKQQQTNNRTPDDQHAATPAKPADEKEITGAVFQTGAPPSVSNNIDGQCVDETGKPLAGVEIILASAAWDGTSRQEVAKQTTDPKGHFHFADVVDIHREYPDGKIPKFPNQNIATFQIAALKPGRESLSETLDQNQIASNGEKVHFAMNPGATLRGRITNPAGQPVAGALVSVGFGQFDRWEGFQTVRTKADGSYEITDAPTLKSPDPKDGPPSELQADPPSDTFALTTRAKYQKVCVTLTDYADRLASCQGIPGTQDIQLKPATIIRGRVLDATTNNATAGTHIFAMPSHVQGAPDVDANFASATPDASGEYQIHTLPAGTYDLWATGPNRVNKVIKNFKTTGAEVTAPDLLLTTGGILRVRLVNDKNGEPVALSENDNAQIVVEPSPPYNPVGFITPVDGRFSVRVIPGDVQITSASAVSNGELKWLIRPGDITPAHVDEGKSTDVDVSLQKFDATTEKKAQELFKRAMTAQRAGDDRKAKAAYDEMIELDSTFPLNMQACFLDAHLLATSSEEGVRDGKRAIQLAKKAIELQRTPEPQLLDTLAAAYADTDDFDKAIQTQQQAIDLAAKDNRDKEYRPALKLYESHQPRQPKPAPKASSKQGADSPPANAPHAAAQSVTATLNGHVSGPDGEAISGATVSITPASAPATAESTNTRTKTDSSGNFKLEALKPFDLAAYHNRIDELKKRSVDGNILYIPPAILTVEATGCATKQIAPQSIPGQQDVQLERPAIIEGRVLFEEGDDQRGAGNVLVVAVATFTDETSRLYSSGRYLLLRADVHTDPDGKYRFTTLPPGSFSVFASAPDWTTGRTQSADSNTKTPVQVPDITLTKRGIDDSRSEENKQKLTAPLLATMAKDNGYELKADQDVRRVAPPFAPIRLQYYGAENPLQADVLPAGPDAMTFLWNDGKLQGHGMFFTGLRGYTLPELVDAIFGLPNQQTEGPSDLLRDGLPGDWVIRKDADEGALAAQLQHILQTELAQPVKLRIATVERSVYVAHGNFTGSPVPVSWAKQYAPRPRADSLSPGPLPGEGPYRLNLFLNWVGDWIRTPIVSEVPDAPMNVFWRLDELRDNIKHDDTHDAERILADLTTQTGIEFALEKRAIKMMFVERATP